MMMNLNFERVKWSGLEDQDGLLNPDEVSREIENIGHQLMNPNDPGLEHPKGFYGSNLEGLEGIVRYVRAHEGDRSTVTMDGLKMLIKIASSKSSSSHQAQRVIYDLLSKHPSSSSINQIYYHLRTSLLWFLSLFSIHDHRSDSGLGIWWVLWYLIYLSQYKIIFIASFKTVSHLFESQPINKTSSPLKVH